MSQPFTIGASADSWPATAKTLEETTELGTTLAQLIAFPDGHRVDGKDILSALHDELADAQAAIGAFLKLNGQRLDTAYIDSRRRRKMESYLRWHRSLVDIDEPTDADHRRTMALTDG
jgi:hypothetical protein